LVFEGSLNGRHIEVVGDTGASTNVISREFAQINGLLDPENYNPNRSGYFLVSALMEIRQEGELRAEWRFAGSREIHLVTFAVIEAGPDILFGSGFLIESGALIIGTGSGALRRAEPTINCLWWSYKPRSNGTMPPVARPVAERRHHAQTHHSMTIIPSILCYSRRWISFIFFQESS